MDLVYQIGNTLEILTCQCRIDWRERHIRNFFPLSGFPGLNLGFAEELERMKERERDSEQSTLRERRGLVLRLRVCLCHDRTCQEGQGQLLHETGGMSGRVAP